MFPILCLLHEGATYLLKRHGMNKLLVNKIWALLFNVFLTIVPLSSRGPPLLIMALFSTVHSWREHEGTEWHELGMAIPYMVSDCAMLGLASFTVYMIDQRKSMCLMALQRAVIHTTHKFSHAGTIVVPYEICWAVFILVWLYGVVWIHRKQRRMPPCLAGAKFVSWRYLRFLATKGERIKRCQDMPSWAFGDITKAMKVVSVSHRWYDPWTNDIVTRSCPFGVKLKALLHRLEEHFWPPHFRSWSAMTVSTSDVVLFFDFMSLPQDGIDEDGKVVSRTDADKKVFETCLPHMGTLYSQFNVLVLDELPEIVGDYRNYHESGWCMCEFMIAAMGKQLHQLSATSLRHPGCDSLAMIATEAVIDHRAKTDVLTRVCSTLEKACFSQESDRPITIGIVTRFLCKRMLGDAIICGDATAISQTLCALDVKAMEVILNEPVDKHLNTLLHIAVMAGHVEICRELLRHGARPSTTNVYGDKPVEKFMFPRLGPAAMLVRAHSKNVLPKVEACSDREAESQTAASGNERGTSAASGCDAGIGRSPLLASGSDGSGKRASRASMDCGQNASSTAVELMDIRLLNPPQFSLLPPVWQGGFENR
eukprot:TRINITY_DN28791_c0_g2_i2.p1 TRINITY_DN28791_c0_g2~~TRINITY_DN28791_c0_g2_i2.p1  ORF type:complete len:595 (+),score=51.81 TRINITY_DN28791_c0_g2_i2:99-1883(+)